MSPAEFWKRPGPSLASLGFLWMLTSFRLSWRRICVKRKQEPGRALAQGGVFSPGATVFRASVRTICRSEHKAFCEKAPSEEKNLRWCCCDAGS